MAKSRKINLTNLLISTENYRFEPVVSQKVAIDIMIEDQGDKLFNLAAHMVKYGLNPNDRVQIALSSHDKKKYNVLEGNRRIVALKLLNNPDIIDSPKHISLKRKFRKLHDENKARIIRDVECTIYDNPAEADIWIKLKHAGQSEGVGTVAWNAQQVHRFDEKVEGKSSIALQTIKALKNSPAVPSDIKDNLSELKITNLDRLLSDPDVRDFLGIDIYNGTLQSEIAESEVLKGLIHIVKDLLKPDFNVKKIYSKDDRKDYLKKFPKTSKPNTSSLAPQPWQLVGTTVGSAPGLKQKLKPHPTERATLIPKSCILKIKIPKVNAIYHELQRLKIEKYTNAAAVLYRVFIELSVDSYIEEHSLTGNPSAAKSGMDLQQKVNQVAQHLETKRLADAAICKGIRASIKDKNSLLGIDTWHAYVHNNKFAPTSDNLRITWDNMQSFMTILWGNIK